MLFQRETKRLLAALLALFAIIAITAGYWAINGSLSLLNRPDNPRLIEAEAAVRRGRILDRNGEALVVSVPSDEAVNSTMQRTYLLPASYSAIGYYSLRFGLGGVESSYDAWLSGRGTASDFETVLLDEIIERPRTGTDITLTLDTEVQTRLADRLAGSTGAGVVIAVPSGDVLALVSLPTFDPNTLDENWDSLVTDPGQPFFNRALQGRYQPGGVLQIPLMAAASLVETPFDTRYEDGTAPLEVNGVNVTCAVRLPPGSLTLADAFSFACPRPFAALADTLGVDIVAATFDTFRLNESPSLPGFAAALAAPTPGILTPTPIPGPDAEVETALGQGENVVSPLLMALITAGIINDGSAPGPRILSGVGSENDTFVIPTSERPLGFPIATADTARRLQDLMRAAVANGAAQNAGRPGIDIGGHASLAYAGDETLAWFVGFTTLNGGQSVAIAVVVENSADPGLAADIGGDVLSVAYEALSD